jgi:hypothetical protein
MSIKIYEGYRIPLGKIVEATQWIHRHQSDSAYEWFCGLASGRMERGVERPTTAIVERCIQSLRSQENSPFNLQRGFNLWLDNCYAYIIPYGQTLAGACPDYFEDFHYQNSVDPPEDIPADEYEARAQKWEQIGAFHFDRVFNHPTINSSLHVYGLENRWIEDVWNKRSAA